MEQKKVTAVFALVLPLFEAAGRECAHSTPTSSRTCFQSSSSSCLVPSTKKSRNMARLPPIKLQSTNEDGVRRQITSNILSRTQAPSLPATKLASR